SIHYHSPYHLFFLRPRPPPTSTLFPYTTLFRSHHQFEQRQLAHAAAPGNLQEEEHRQVGEQHPQRHLAEEGRGEIVEQQALPVEDRKSTRLNSSHVKISYAVFCLKKKKQKRQT